MEFSHLCVYEHVTIEPWHTVAVIGRECWVKRMNCLISICLGCVSHMFFVTIGVGYN